MAAAAYKVMAVFALGSPRGPTKTIALTASDVNGEYWLFPSGDSSIALNGDKDVFLVDAILSAAGTDTSQVEFFVGGESTGTKLLNAASLYNAGSGRPFQQAPLRIPRGLQFKAKQLT